MSYRTRIYCRLGLHFYIAYFALGRLTQGEQQNDNASVLHSTVRNFQRYAFQTPKPGFHALLSKILLFSLSWRGITT